MDEPVVDGLVRPVLRGRITPPQPAKGQDPADHEDDVIDDPAGTSCDNGVSLNRCICASDNHVQPLTATPPRAIVESNCQLISGRFNSY